MKNVSTRLKVIGLISIFLWIGGSILILNEDNGKPVSLVVAIIITAGLYSQMLKERRKNSEA